MPHPRCTERIGSTDALSPHVAADPGAGTRCLRLLTEHTPEETPEQTQALAQSSHYGTREWFTPLKISKFRVSDSVPLLWLHRQGTYKDSTLTVTKQASELLLPVGWDLDPTEKFSFPKGTETSHFFFLLKYCSGLRLFSKV